MNLDSSQLAAVDFAASSPFAVITGGAGTGKTTIIAEITRRIESLGGEVYLCAFAGKAAARLREATKHDATTIHRMLGSNGEKFQRETLNGLSVIVDEASMVSSDLMAEIILRHPSRLILVGDQAQLPPVGSGQPFHDIIRFKPALVRNLSTCYRATEAIFIAATAIREGLKPAMLQETPGERWEVLECGDAESTHALLMDLIEDGRLDFEQDLILCPRNGESDQAATVAGLNAAIVAMVNPRQDGEKWKAGDRVINTKNCADKDVWNGTTGTIHDIDIDNQIWIKLDIPIVDQELSTPGDEVYTDEVLFTKDMAKELQLAYALTVHKSQGSQYRRIYFVCLHRDGFALLDRSLIYTAITRARAECVVVGQRSALFAGIARVTEKRTVFQEMEVKP